MKSVTAVGALPSRVIRRRCVDGDEAACTGLVAGLRAGTRELHAAAEKSGILSELLCGRGTIAGHALLLRNLLPAYRAMESILRDRRRSPGYEVLADPGLFRQQAIESDLKTMAGPGWRTALPVLPVAERYARRIQHVGHAADRRWLGHVYTRYLGDMSGGRILKRILLVSPGLPADALGFYEFPDLGRIDDFKARYLASLDALAAETGVAQVVREARIAFLYNIALSDALGPDRGK